MKFFLNLLLVILIPSSSFLNFNFLSLNNFNHQILKTKRRKLLRKNVAHDKKNDDLLPWTDAPINLMKIHDQFFSPDDVDFYNFPQNDDIKLIYDNIKNFSSTKISNSTFRQKFIFLLAQKLDNLLETKEFEYFQTSDYFFRTYLKMIENNNDQFYFSILKTNQEWKTTLNNNQKSFQKIQNILPTNMESFYVRFSNQASNNWNINTSFFDFTVLIANFSMLNGYNFNQKQLKPLSLNWDPDAWIAGYDISEWMKRRILYGNGLWEWPTWTYRIIRTPKTHEYERLYFMYGKNWPISRSRSPFHKIIGLGMNNSLNTKSNQYKCPLNSNYDINDPKQFKVLFSFNKICPEFHNFQITKYFLNFSKLGSISYLPKIRFVASKVVNPGHSTHVVVKNPSSKKAFKQKQTADVKIDKVIKSSNNSQEYHRIYHNTFFNKSPIDFKKHSNPISQNEFLYWKSNANMDDTKLDDYSDLNSYWGFYLNIFAFKNNNSFTINWEAVVKEYLDANLHCNLSVPLSSLAPIIYADYCQINYLKFQNLTINYKSSVF